MLAAYQWGIFAIALGTFGIGTTEFMPMGLLPVIAEGVNASIPAAGLLISAYAVGVMVGAPLITLYLTKYSHKTSLLALMAVFVVGNLLSAMSVNYETFLVSRIITSLSHGAFFGIGAVVAMNLAPYHKKGSAVASIFLGLTIANIIGVPITTWLGQTFDWRLSFAVTAVLGVVAILGISRSLPAMAPAKKPDVKTELKAIMQPAALRAFATTVMCAGSMFTLYTYITPVMQTLAQATDNTIATMLMLVGIGFTLGNYVSGKITDKSPDLALFVFLALQVLVLLMFRFTATTTMGAGLTVLLWGTVIFGSGPPLQMQVMKIADQAPGLASSINIGAFNLGNALGAALGGLVISIGFGFDWIPGAAAILSFLALIMVFINRYKSKL
ncbi:MULTISPECIES: MFS transporter [Marinomonas]|uniref:MFS transporter n=1 Tax=Marinomonas arctica TaxID=383750 RepID=A0A7H1JBJ6_9GAMM|nr:MULTISPECIES: MFS transporter [Marinomonas]MCS7485562.1 MFS transporter [Marinomonas sp. BSi20414]QNT07862.1 MFS transporter [Marinomonas arctica]GGN25982.1 inner membrane transport protein YdhP [Marinomonas arctica]